LHAIEGKVQLGLQINQRHQLSGNIAIPLFGILVRPPYTGWDKEISEISPLFVVFKGKPSTLNDFLVLNGAMTYLYNISTKLDLMAQYQFYYYKTERIKAAKMFRNQYNLGINLKF